MVDNYLPFECLYVSNALRSTTINMDVSKERKTIKDFLKADQSKQQKLKTEFEKEILQPD